MITRQQSLIALAVTAMMAVSLVGRADMVVSPSQVEDKLAVENVRVIDGTLHGDLVNHTDHRVADIALRVDYAWLWKNEFKPGDVSPSWSATTEMAAALAPGETLAFNITPDRTMEARDDGHFVPSVSVVGYTVYTRPTSP